MKNMYKELIQVTERRIAAHTAAIQRLDFHDYTAIQIEQRMLTKALADLSFYRDRLISMRRVP